MQRPRSYHARRARVDRAGRFARVAVTLASAAAFGCASPPPPAEEPAPAPVLAPAPVAPQAPVVRVHLSHATGWWELHTPGGRTLVDARVPELVLMPVRTDRPLEGPRALLDAWLEAAGCEADEHAAGPLLVVVPRGAPEALLDVATLQARLEDPPTSAALAAAGRARRPVRVLVEGTFAGADEDALGVKVERRGLVTVDRRGRDEPAIARCQPGDRVRVICEWSEERLRLVRFDD